MTARSGGTGQEPGGHPSRFAIAQRLAGELDAMQAAEFSAHLSGCPECALAFRQAEKTASEFAQAYPTREWLAATRKSKRQGSGAPGGLPLRSLWDWLGGRRGHFAFGLLLFMAAAGVMYQWDGTGGPRPDTFLAKGGSAFYLFINGKQAAGDTLVCAPGDTLQLGIIGPGPVHYAVLYSDDGGQPKTYFSASAAGDARIGSPHGQNLPNSLVLDSGWRSEVLFCIWSTSSFTEAEAQALATGAGARPEAGSLRLKIFRLRNGVP